MKKLNAERLQANLQRGIQKDIDEGILSGASTLVVQGGEIRARVCLGYADMTEKIPMSAGNIFRLASMTKPVTAAAVLIQVERGKLRLEDKVSSYLPDFTEMWVGGKDENGNMYPARRVGEDRPIRIVNLLTHTNGLLSGELGMLQSAKIPVEALQSLETAVDHYGKHVLLDFAPEEQAYYSATAAFDVAARLVEMTADMPYAEFVRKNIFEPLGMENTTFVPTEEQWKSVVKMHSRLEDGTAQTTNTLEGNTFEHFPLTYTCGGASLCATIDDYARFAGMLLRDGAADTRVQGLAGAPIQPVRILSEESIRRMRTPFPKPGTPGIGPTETWGLGVRVITADPAVTVGAFGWSGAYGTHFWVDRENDLIAIYMKNSRYDGGSGAQTARRFEAQVYDAMDTVE